VLAERAGMSKQAMNQLLLSLETAGYIERSAAEDDGRTRVVRLTRRGRAAYDRMAEVLKEIERDWAAELGTKAFADLKTLLARVWHSPLAWDPPGAGPVEVRRRARRR